MPRNEALDDTEVKAQAQPAEEEEDAVLSADSADAAAGSSASAPSRAVSSEFDWLGDARDGHGFRCSVDATIVAEVVQEDPHNTFVSAASSQDLQFPEWMPHGHDNLAGNYCWRTPDGSTEAILRLQPSGRWWHATHCGGIGRDRSRGSLAQGFGESGQAWELAEAVGSWSEVPVPNTLVGQDDLSPCTGILLACDGCRWSMDPSGNASQLTLCPKPRNRLEIDDLIAKGHLILLLAVQECEVPRFGPARTLDLLLNRRRVGLPGESGHAQLHCTQEAVRGLGFARRYCEPGAEEFCLPEVAAAVAAAQASEPPALSNLFDLLGETLGFLGGHRPESGGRRSGAQAARNSGF